MMFTKWYRRKDTNPLTVTFDQTNPLTVTFDQWDEWKPLPKDREQEILDYIERGYAYQISTVEAVSVVGYEVDLLHADPTQPK